MWIKTRLISPVLIRNHNKDFRLVIIRNSRNFWQKWVLWLSEAQLQAFFIVFSYNSLPKNILLFYCYYYSCLQMNMMRFRALSLNFFYYCYYYVERSSPVIGHLQNSSSFSRDLCILSVWWGWVGVRLEMADWDLGFEMEIEIWILEM